MNQKKLSNFVKFTQGVNQTRLKKTNNLGTIQLYDQSSFEEDMLIDTEPNAILFNEELKQDITLREGDIVINEMKQNAAIVSSTNSGKVLPMNFIRVEFKTENLDKRYFVYLFNANKAFARKKERESQGTAAVMKIPIRQVEQLEILCLPLKEQKKVGMSYMKMMSLKKKYHQMALAHEHLTLSILEDRIKGEIG